MQTLVHLGSRVSFEALDKELPKLKAQDARVKSAQELRSFITPIILQATKEPEQLMQDLGIKGRNAFFYYLGCRLQELGLPADTKLNYVSSAYSALRDTSGFSYEEALAAARVK